MTSRQVQKLSVASFPRLSLMPAMARWKVWLCTFEGAGNSTFVPSVASPGPGATPVSTDVIVPAPSQATRTFPAHPSGNKARSANRLSTSSTGTIPLLDTTCIYMTG